MPTNITILILVSAVIRLILMNLFPMTADESYYWLWSKHLALSYVDHPPLIAYINYLATMGKENLPALRLGAMLISTLCALLIYFIAKVAFNNRIAFWSALIFFTIPHFLVIWLTQFVELPLSLFWLLSVFILLWIVKEKEKWPWYPLGLTVGLGCLSKYTMFLFWPSLAFFFILAPEHRFWLKKKQPYMALIISLLVFSPVLFWNSQLNWISFAYHGAKTVSDPWGAHTLEFIGDQLIHYSPFIIFSLIPAYIFAFKKNHYEKLFFSFSAPVLVLFLLVSLKIKVWAHWPAIGYLTALPLITGYFGDNNRSVFKFYAWLAGFSTLILAILFWVSPAIMLHQNDYAANYTLPDRLPKEYKIFAKTNVTTSLLEFYLKRQTYLATGFLKQGSIWGEKQYELWGIPSLSNGETIIYFGEMNDLVRKDAENNFTKITELPDIKLYLIEDYITNNFKFYKMEGYRGKPNQHP